MERASGPATITSTLRAVRRSGGGGTWPQVGTSPQLVFSPKMPQAWAGQRAEPPRSEASSKAAIPVATAAAAPPDEPPGERAGSHGLFEVP